MLNCVFSLCLLNLNVFPKMAVFHIEMLIVTDFSGIHISSLDTCWFFFFSSDCEQPCGERYV